MYQPPIGGWLLIGWCPVPINFIVPDRIPSFPTAIAGVAFDGVDKAAFYFLHNAYMVNRSILTIFTAPVKENNVAWARLIAVILPESPIFEPLNSIDTSCKFRDHASIQIPALVGTPTDKASTPLHTGAKAIP